MGSWDCYCAICAASLTGGQIGSWSWKAREWRRKRLEKKRRELQPGEDSESDQSSQEEEDEEDKEDLDRFHEDNSYDPDLISEEGLEWLRTSHCLGFNPDAVGSSKCVSPVELLSQWVPP